MAFHDDVSNEISVRPGGCAYMLTRMPSILITNPGVIRFCDPPISLALLRTPVKNMAEEVAAPVVEEPVAPVAPVVVELTLPEAIKAVLLKARMHDGLKRGLHECVHSSYFAVPAVPLASCSCTCCCLVQVCQDLGPPSGPRVLLGRQLQR